MQSEGRRQNFWLRRTPTFENELQKAMVTLQQAEISKSRSEANLTKVNTGLKNELQKARAMLKEEDEFQEKRIS